MSHWRFNTQQLLQIGELLPPSPTFSPPSHQQLAGKLVMLTELHTSVPTMWQIVQQLEFILAVFPSFSFYPHLFLPVLEKTLPLPSLFHKFVIFFSFFYNVLTKNKTSDQTNHKKRPVTIFLDYVYMVHIRNK